MARDLCFSSAYSGSAIAVRAALMELALGDLVHSAVEHGSHWHEPVTNLGKKRAPLRGLEK